MTRSCFFCKELQVDISGKGPETRQRGLAQSASLYSCALSRTSQAGCCVRAGKLMYMQQSDGNKACRVTVVPVLDFF